MSLRDFVIREKEVEVEGQSFKVKGLSLNDLQILVDSHLDALAGAFSGNLSIDYLVKEVPELASAIVCQGVTEEGVEDYVGELPVGVVLEAVKSILELTFPNAEALIKMVGKMTEERSLPTTNPQKAKSKSS